MANAGLIWAHVTLVVAAIWVFIRVKPIALAVAVAVTYAATILGWLVAIHFNMPTPWAVDALRVQHPIALVTAMSACVGWLTLRSMRLPIVPPSGSQNVGGSSSVLGR